MTDIPQHPDPCQFCRYRTQACAYIMEGNKKADACLDKMRWLRRTTPAPQPPQFTLDAGLRAEVIETLREAGCPCLAEQVRDETIPKPRPEHIPDGMTDAQRKYILSFQDEDPLLMSYVAGLKAGRVEAREEEREKIRVIVAHAIKEERERVLDKLQSALKYEGIFALGDRLDKMRESLRTDKEKP